jgi:hypothetical protein
MYAVVKSRSHFRALAAVLCVLALAAAQLLGAQRHYVCLCIGEAVRTASTHCHGPHTADCHAPGQQEPDDHREEDQGSRDDHILVQGKLDLMSAGAVSALMPPNALLAWPAAWEQLFARVYSPPPRAGHTAAESPPPPGVAVARTVVLLI